MGEITLRAVAEYAVDGPEFHVERDDVVDHMAVEVAHVGAAGRQVVTGAYVVTLLVDGSLWLVPFGHLYIWIGLRDALAAGAVTS